MLEIAQNLRNLKKKWDWIYIDPSRRMIPKEKFFTKDCLPNVPANLELYFKYSEAI
jgi:hypothetical protein